MIFLRKSLRGRSGFHIDIHSSVPTCPLKTIIDEWISFPRVFHTDRFVFFKFVKERIHQIQWRHSLTNDTSEGLIFYYTRIRLSFRNSWKELFGSSSTYPQDIYTRKTKTKQNTYNMCCKHNMLIYISWLTFCSFYFNSVNFFSLLRWRRLRS